MKAMQKVAIIGGTGKAGKYVIDEMLRRNIHMKVLARNPDKITQKNPLIEIVTGSVRNYSTVQRLLNGCDGVISTLGPSKNEPDTCSIATGHLIRIIPQAGIKRYIEVAGLAIDTPADKKGMKTKMITGVIRTFFGKVVNDRQKGYEMLANSTVKWTIIRCPMIELTDERRSLKISLDDSPGNKISASDLAAFLADQLNSEEYIGKCPFVAS